MSRDLINFSIRVECFFDDFAFLMLSLRAQKTNVFSLSQFVHSNTLTTNDFFPVLLPTAKCTLVIYSSRWFLKLPIHVEYLTSITNDICEWFTVLWITVTTYIGNTRYVRHKSYAHYYSYLTDRQRRNVH